MLMTEQFSMLIDTRIRDRLSPAEIKKLSIAAERCKD